jgi:ATP-dependent exoDNAse (exonuclease V) alpha subunit
LGLPQYGKQFTVENYTTLLPATIQGIRRYLGSGLVKGIGPVFADRITQHFGLDTLQIIEEEPKRLIEVPGLGPKRTKKIAEAWEEQKAIKEVMLFLQTVEVSTSIAVRIYKKYGDASISSSRTSRTASPPTSGASASSPPTRSPSPSASRTTARSASRPASSTPFRRPPTRATASSPRSG